MPHRGRESTALSHRSEAQPRTQRHFKLAPLLKSSSAPAASAPQPCPGPVSPVSSLPPSNPCLPQSFPSLLPTTTTPTPHPPPVDTKSGLLTQVTYDGRDLLAAPLTPVFWRPPTDNDHGWDYARILGHWRNAGIPASPMPSSLSVVAAGQLGPDGKRVKAGTYRLSGVASGWGWGRRLGFG